MSTTAPAELLLLEFPGNRFEGKIVAALAELVDAGTITVLDAVLVVKEDDGTVSWLEAANGPAAELAALVGEPSGHLAEDDVLAVADELEPGSSVGMLVFEHTWARDLAEAIQQADGRVIDMVRIPATTMAVMDQIIGGAR